MSPCVLWPACPSGRADADPVRCKNDAAPEDDHGIERFGEEDHAEDREDGQAEEVDRHDEARRGPRERLGEAEVGREAREADHHEPEARDGRGPGGLAVGEGAQEAQHRLDQREPEHDGDDGIVARQPLGQDDRAREEHGRARGREHAHIERGEVGPGHDQDAREAHHGGEGAQRGDALAQEEGREQDHPERRSEFERDHLRERDEAQGPEPQVLPGEVRQVAHQMAPEMPGADLAQPPGKGGPEEDDREPHQRAPGHDLERVVDPRDHPPRDGHRREGGDGAGHPEGGREKALLGRHLQVRF